MEKEDWKRRCVCYLPKGNTQAKTLPYFQLSNFYEDQKHRFNIQTYLIFEGK